ncbi:MAG: hypothetical protein DGJ47_000334 [Rickettsiaceae bacterium]
MKNKVNIVPYDPSWPKEYQNIESRIKNALGDNICQIHHVGSTSVPGLASKHKIDVCLQVNDAQLAVKALEQIGFEYKGEWSIPFKYGFRYRHEISINLHMFDFGHPAIQSNLMFRDFLRNNESERQEYEKLKYKIAKEEDSHDKDQSFLYNYTIKKANFIHEVIKKTDFDGIYLQYCATPMEKDFVNQMRLKNNVKELKNNEFFIDNQRHFVLYHGVKICGYANLELRNDDYITTIRSTILAKYELEFKQLLLQWCISSVFSGGSR